MAPAPEITIAPLLAALLSLLTTFGLPLGVPPLPPDGAIERAAPDECLVYWSWSGVATPDPKSENQTELLLAEPEVRKFIGAIDEQFTRAFKAGAGSPEEQAIGEEAPRVIRALLTHSTAMFVENVVIGNGPPQFSAGMAVNLGDDRAKIETSLRRLLPVVPAGEEIRGVPCQQVASPPGAPEIWWGTKGKYLMLGVGKQSLSNLIARMSDSKRAVPAWLAAAREKMKVERVSQTSFVNVQAIKETVGPATSDQIFIANKALGIDTMKTVSAVSGLNRSGTISRALVEFGGPPTGLLGMLGDKPLVAEDFQPAPLDAPFAIVIRVPLAELYDAALEIAAPSDPAEKEKMMQQIEGAQAAFGISLRDHILALLGDRICVHSPGASSGNPLGAILSITVRDRAKLVKHEKALVGVIEKIALGQPGGPKLKTETKGDLTLRSLLLPGAAVTPSWTISKEEFVFGMSPDAVNEYVNRPSASQTLANQAGVAAILRRPTGPSLVSFTDLKDSIGPQLATFQGLTPMFNGQLATIGVPFQLPPLPAPGVIVPRMRPSFAAITRSSGGVMIERAQSVPLVADAVTVGPVALGMMIPAVQAARAAAQGNNAANNPKPIE